MKKPTNLPAKLTEQSIRKLPIPTKDEGRYDVQDHQVTSLYLRVYPSGNKSWTFRYRFDGTSKRFNIGDASLISPAKARNKAKSLAGEVANGKDPNAAKQAVREKQRKAKKTT